jgi:hypothetical protein
MERKGATMNEVGCFRNGIAAWSVAGQARAKP